jgi:hypothetical protein
MAKVVYHMKLDLSKVPRGQRGEVKKEIGDFLLKRVKEDLEVTRSPVTGRLFKTLKKGPYKDFKRANKGTAAADLDLYGDMQNAMEARPTRGGVNFGIWDNEQAKKADNHNKFSGKSLRTKVPKRSFIPNKKNDEQFRPAIRDSVNKIIKENEK